MYPIAGCFVFTISVVSFQDVSGANIACRSSESFLAYAAACVHLKIQHLLFKGLDLFSAGHLDGVQMVDFIFSSKSSSCLPSCPLGSEFRL